MTNVVDHPAKVSAKDAITAARKEIQEEQQGKAVDALKVLLRKEAMAQTTLENIQREIADLQVRIEQGNLT